jgi:hypothetical protein
MEKFASLIQSAAAKGIQEAPKAVDAIVGGIATFAANQFKAAKTDEAKQRAIQDATSAFALGRAKAAEDGVDLTGLETSIQNVATKILGPNADPQLVVGMEKAIKDSKSQPAPALPSNLPPVFSPAKAAAPAAAPQAAAAEAPAEPAAEAAAEPQAVAASPSLASRAVSALKNIAKPKSPLKNAGVDVRKMVLDKFRGIPKNLFAKSKEAELKPELTEVIRLLGNETGLPEAKVAEAVNYMLQTTANQDKEGRQRIIMAMIEISMQDSEVFVGENKLPAKTKQKRLPDPFVKAKEGPVSGVMGGFGKPASAKRPRFEKGSAEAKAYMAELRAKRRK